MESGFVTQQHVDSLRHTDPGFAEVLNRYKFAPSNPPVQSQSSGFSGAPNGAVGAVGHTDAVLLSNMLGQIQAGLRGNGPTPTGQGFDGFQLNINSDVLKWIVLLLLILLLVWLFLKANKKRKNPLSKRLEQVESQLHLLKRKSKKSSPAVEDESDDLDALEMNEDFSEDSEDL